jgi:hypothetical protein
MLTPPFFLPHGAHHLGFSRAATSEVEVLALDVKVIECPSPLNVLTFR